MATSEIDVVTAAGVCRLLMDGPRGTHCALGWADKADLGYRELHRFRRGFLRAAAHLGLVSDYGGNSCVADINDCRRNNKADIALCINVGFAAVGYTVGQDPQAMQLARRLKLV